MFYISEQGAKRAAERAIAEGRATGFEVSRRSQRCPDRTVEIGFVAALFVGRAFVGLAGAEGGAA